MRTMRSARFSPARIWPLVCWTLILALLSPANGAAPENITSSDPLTVVKGLYNAFDRGDLQTVIESLSEDVIWTQYGPGYALPFAGVFHGPPGVAEFFKIVDDTLTDVHAGQREYLVSGDRVVVPGWEESTVRRTDGHYRVNNVHVFTVVNGKITQFEEYIDNAEILEAFQPAEVARGRALFTACAGCHGNQAEGRPAMHAPNLTGLGTAYILKQLRAFRAGHRGNTADEYGFMMIGRAQALSGDRALRDVAAFIGTLTTQRSSSTSVAGRVDRGRTLFAPCARCHGADAEGNLGLGAPALRQQDDRYLEIQMRHFASGIRGANPNDIAGAQMRAAANALPNTKAVADVIAYIESR